METPLKISEASLCGKRRRKIEREENKVSNNIESPPGKLTTSDQQINPENVRKKFKLSNECSNSVVERLCEQQSPLNLNTEKSLPELENCRNNLVDQTIDLCDGDSSFDGSPLSGTLAPPPDGRSKQEIVIDLISDTPAPQEIIDLTVCKPLSTVQPTVIDLSDEVPKEEPKLKSENDEICLIGVFKKKCLSKKRTPKKTISPKKWPSLLTCSEKLKKKYLKRYSNHDKTGNNENVKKKKKKKKKKKLVSQNQTNTVKENVTKVGENIYVKSPMNLPSSGLRPIIIDGSNVAFVRSSCNFCCKRLEICINYFKEKGHKVTAFVPQFRVKMHKSDDPELLRKLEEQGDVVLTPSKNIDGKNIVPYDDRFIVQTAVLKGGVIVTRDNYNDLLRENPAWAETIKYRTLAFTWVDDVLMFPKDPLGEFGPSLEEFLRFH